MFSNLIIQGSWRYYLGVLSNEQQRYHMGMVSAIPFVYLIQYVCHCSRPEAVKNIQTSLSYKLSLHYFLFLAKLVNDKEPLLTPQIGRAHV